MRNIIAALAFIALTGTALAQSVTITVTPVNNPPPSTVTIGSTNPAVIYSRAGNNPSIVYNWTLAASGSDLSGNDYYSNFTRNPYPGTQVKGPDAVVNFTGTGITWVGQRGPNFGISAWSLDGGAQSGTVDGYAPNNVYRQNLLTLSGLADGSHSLKIEVTNATNGSDYYVDIDAFVITGSDAAALSPTASLGAPSMSPYFTSGTWGCFPGITNYSDISTSHCVGASGDLVWPFNGSMLEVFGRPDCEDGYSQMFVDGNFVGTTDWVWGEVDDDAVNSYAVFTWKGAPGSHTIDIRATGTTDSQCPGNNAALLQIDTLMAFP